MKFIPHVPVVEMRGGCEQHIKRPRCGQGYLFTATADSYVLDVGSNKIASKSVDPKAFFVSCSSAFFAAYDWSRS